MEQYCRSSHGLGAAIRTLRHRGDDVSVRVRYYGQGCMKQLRGRRRAGRPMQLLWQQCVKETRRCPLLRACTTFRQIVRVVCSPGEREFDQQLRVSLHVSYISPDRGHGSCRHHRGEEIHPLLRHSNLVSGAHATHQLRKQKQQKQHPNRALSRVGAPPRVAGAVGWVCRGGAEGRTG